MDTLRFFVEMMIRFTCDRCGRVHHVPKGSTFVCPCGFIHKAN